MSNGKIETYKVSTHSTLGDAGAEWSVSLDEGIMFPYQIYANTLVAAVIAKLGEFAIELANNPNALKEGTEAIVQSLNKV